MHIGNGIPVVIQVFHRYDDCNNITNDKDKILEEIGKYIDLEDYNVIVYENAIELKLNKEIFNENIHEFIKEMESSTACYRDLFYNHDLPLEDFTKEKYELKLCEYDENYTYKDEEEKENLKGEYYLKCDNDDIRYEESYYPDIWLLEGKYRMYSKKIKLWYDPNDIEDGGYIIPVLNTYKKNYYKNKLGNDLIYYVE